MTFKVGVVELHCQVLWRYLLSLLRHVAIWGMCGCGCRRCRGGIRSGPPPFAIADLMKYHRTTAQTKLDQWSLFIMSISESRSMMIVVHKEKIWIWINCRLPRCWSSMEMELTWKERGEEGDGCYLDLARWALSQPGRQERILQW